MLSGLILISELTAFFTMTSATLILSKNGAPPVCGTIDLVSGGSQRLYAGACYELQGKAQGAHVNSSCNCEFFP